MAKYLKLGNDRVHIFYDQITLVKIVNKQVIRLENERDLRKKSLRKALQTGHIKEATEAEYNAYHKINDKLLAEAPKVTKVVTETKTVLSQPAKTPKPPVEDDEETEDNFEDEGLEDDEETQDREDNGDNEDNEDNDDDDNEEEELSKSELIDFLKASPLIDEAKKKKLTQMKHENLQNLYAQVKTN